MRYKLLSLILITGCTVLLGLPGEISAQQNIETSTIFLLREATGDTAAITELIRSVQRRHIKDKDSALAHVDTIIKRSIALNYDYGIGFAYYWQGIIHFHSQEYDASTKSFERAIPYFEQANALNMVGECSRAIGVNYRFLADYKRAKGWMERGLAVFEGMPKYVDPEKDQLRVNGICAINYFLWTNLFVQNKLQEGMPYLARIKQLRDATGVIDANLYNTFGVVFTQMGLQDSALTYLQEGLPHAIEQNRLDLQALLYINLGGVLSSQNKLDQAEAYTLKAEEIAEAMPNYYYLSQTHMNLAKINQQRGDQTKALEHQIEALRLARSQGPRQYVIDALTLLGKFYVSINDLENGLIHLEEARDLAEELNSKLLLAVSLKDIGEVYTLSGEREKALDHFNRSLELNRNLNNNHQLNANIFHAKAELYKEHPLGRADIDSAVSLYQAALAAYQKDSFLRSEAKSRIGLGELYLKNDQPSKAIAQLEQALAITNEIQTKVEWYKAHQLLSYAYEANGDFDLALSSYRKFMALKDSVTNAEVLNELNNIKEKYETGRKDMTIASLEKRSAIKQRQLNLSIAVGSLIVVSLLLAGLLFIQRMRANKKLEQHKMLYEERSRISSDLHDEISSTLSSISMVSSFATDKIKQNEVREAEKLLKEISTTSLQMGEELSDLIWALNPRKDNVSEIVERLQNYASPMASAKQIRLTFDVDEPIKARFLPLEVRKNLYLIMKEAINNAIKYSGCRELVVRLQENAGKLVFVVKDDGNGFDPASLNGEGNGLYNMKERAESIGAEFGISSVLGKGTKVGVEVGY